jgi:hypothetical protein
MYDVSDCLPVDDLNQSVDEQTDLLEERVTKLDSFVVKFNVFTELASKKLHKHLSFESSMP